MDFKASHRAKMKPIASRLLWAAGLALLLALLPGPGGTQAASPAPESGGWPQIEIASDLAPIEGLLAGGSFRLELGPPPAPQGVVEPDPESPSPLHGRLEMELRPDFTAAETAPLAKLQRLTVLAHGLIAPTLDALDDGSAEILLDFADQPSLALRAGFSLRQDSTGLRAAVELAELSLPEAQPLLALIPGWPPLLTLEKGRLNLNFDLAYDGGLTGAGQLALQDSGGIHATAFFRGLDLTIPFHLVSPEDEGAENGGPLLRAGISATIAEFNPGVALAPVRAELAYQGPLSDPGQGRLVIDMLTADLLGGRIAAEPTALALGAPAGKLDLEVVGIDLERVLAIHPVEGLHGSGLIDGRLPLRWGPDGFGTSAGTLAARSPGGQLRYDSRAAAALAQRNPAIKLVLDALADFNYNVLTAGVDYREDGTLNLALRLEGSNPAFERGRPVHLEINLEENIPALLASLQLANRISDTIRQRIEERYR
jgi:hypothetical protein